MQKKISHQVTDLVYQVMGEGEVVVLIHGFAEDHLIWNNVLESFKNCQLILPDLPGSGSSGLTGELTIETMAEAVIAILKAEKVEQCTIIGHSMGGYITLAIVEQHDELIKAFGLFHSSAFPDSEEKKASRKKNIEFIRTHGTAAFLKQSIPALFGEAFKKSHPEAIDQLIHQYSSFKPEALIKYYEAMMARPDRTDVLVNTSKPVLFVIGKEDAAIPFEDSMKLCHLPSLSYIHVLDKSGHMGMLEDPETCNISLKNFIKR